MRIAILQFGDQCLNDLKALLADHVELIEVFRGQADCSRSLLFANSFEIILLAVCSNQHPSLDLLRSMRQQSMNFSPVIVITPLVDPEIAVKFLEAGADDVVKAPFHRGELLMRIKVLHRRSHHYQFQEKDFVFGDYQFSAKSSFAKINEKIVPLTKKEFDLALIFFRNVGKSISRDYIGKRIWGVESSEDSRTIDAHISRLRQKLHIGSAHNLRLKSVYNYGYRLEAI
ncbi:response regulator transcription factor [Leeia sp. TBRC 13508]|uniref:Response regulator transcription factor n=1 Tax=Leeia speluncae TaxID=2884804 RepID=A0ABS8D7U1_9NEIS|nr:response regulator transcription factor [Leeia speluncae]MCB6184252.1 response regulator transcription factor [Leeia speluncae]